MISPHSHQPEAHYDEEGNIILPSDSAADWTVTEDDMPLGAIEQKHARQSRFQAEPKLEEPNEQIQQTFASVRERVSLLGQTMGQEAAQQYRWGFEAFGGSVKQTLNRLQHSRKPLWEFLTQPVWVMNKKKKQVKEYNRLTLFLLDTVRFGGTFAVLFMALFVSLNFQSFWQITQSHLQPIRRVQQSFVGTSVEAELQQKLLKSPSLAVAGQSKGDLLSFLPEVGPPENRIVIPKLHLNVPLVTPSYEALLAEDWNRLEHDIQSALEMGVVHYPGTARPGQAGNFFVTGHSSYYPWAAGDFKTIFARLHELDPGDEYYVYYGGDKHRYVIQEKTEVKPNNVAVLDQPTGKRMATLMTCTPVGTTLRRLILTAQEVDPLTGVPLEIGQHEKRDAPEIKVEALPI